MLKRGKNGKNRIKLSQIDVTRVDAFRWSVVYSTEP